MIHVVVVQESGVVVNVDPMASFLAGGLTISLSPLPSLRLMRSNPYS